MAYTEKIVKYVTVDSDPIEDDQINGLATDLVKWAQGLIDKHGNDVVITSQALDYDGGFELFGQLRVVETDIEFAKRVESELARSAEWKVKYERDKADREAAIIKAIADNDGGLTSL